MTRSANHAPGQCLALATLARRGSVLGLTCLAPMLVGCQTVTPSARALKPPAGAPSANPVDPAVAKTDFHSKVTPDQQFNVHMELGRVYETGQQYDAAIAEYQKALEACERHGFGSGAKGSGQRQSLAHRRIAGALDRLGRFAQAETHYSTALKLSPDDAKVWNDSGYSFYLQSRWTDAERNLKTAARLAPDDVRVQTNLGLALAAAGKTDEALAALSKAGGAAIGHANLGYLLAAMGKSDEARLQYETALDLQPNLPAARQALAALDRKPAATSGGGMSTTDIPMPHRPSPSPTPAIARTAPPSIPMPRQTLTSIPRPRPTPALAVASARKPGAIPLPARPLTTTAALRRNAPPAPTLATASVPTLRTTTARSDSNVQRTSGPRVTPVIVPPPIVMPPLPPPLQ